MNNQIDAPKYAIAIQIKTGAGGGFEFVRLANEKETFAFAEAERYMASQYDKWYCFHICKRGQRIAGCGNAWRYDSLARRFNGGFQYDDMRKDRSWWNFEISPSQMI